MRLAIPAALCAAITATPVQATVLGSCDPYLHPANISEPWEDYTRTFANGAIRIFESFLDPNLAAGSVIGVLYPVQDFEVTRRECVAVFAGEGPRFFAEAQIRDATASYDPARGLTIIIPVTLGDGTRSSVILTVNQATGTVTLP